MGKKVYYRSIKFADGSNPGLALVDELGEVIGGQTEFEYFREVGDCSRVRVEFIDVLPYPEDDCAS